MEYCTLTEGCLFIKGHEYDCSTAEWKQEVPGFGLKDKIATAEAREIVEVLVPEILSLFLDKNSKYRDVRDRYDLGVRGMFPDVNRKVAVLRTRIWDGIETPGEDTDEIINDLIGHLLLMREHRHRERIQNRREHQDDVALEYGSIE